MRLRFRLRPGVTAIGYEIVDALVGGRIVGESGHPSEIAGSKVKIQRRQQLAALQPLDDQRARRLSAARRPPLPR